jgi:TIR domain/Pentapeptide repeats (8 copies)
VADKAQVKILKKGVEAWNTWRKANPEIRPDLCSVDLCERDLTEADLTRADLNGAYLRGTNLWHAELSEANLVQANLVKANLGRAYFSGADLVSANLSGADLTSAHLNNAADLRQANLTGAKLFSANLAGACLCSATIVAADFTDACLIETDFSDCLMAAARFVNVDLSRCKGLETVNHHGPSTIGIDTVYRSGGNIPESFLRGAGVAEDFITFMKSLVGKPVEFYSCFISYSSKDQEFAERLHADLRSKHVRCWFAPEDLKIGDKLRPAFDEAIRVHDKLMVLLSENSVSSPWVEKEVETAFEKERREKRTVLFPIRLDDAVIETGEAWAADIRRTRHIGDFRNWKDHDSYKKAFDRLLRDLESAGKAEPA